MSFAVYSPTTPCGVEYSVHAPGEICGRYKNRGLGVVNRDNREMIILPGEENLSH